MGQQILANGRTDVHQYNWKRRATVNEQGHFHTWQLNSKPTGSRQITNGSLLHISARYTSGQTSDRKSVSHFIFPLKHCLHVMPACINVKVNFNIVLMVMQTWTQRMGWNPWVTHYSLNTKRNENVEVDALSVNRLLQFGKAIDSSFQPIPSTERIFHFSLLQVSRMNSSLTEESMFLRVILRT